MWWVFLVVLAIVAGFIAYVRQHQARQPYRPLTSRQPERATKEAVPLGLEAVDLDHIARTTRRNEALERAHVSWTRGRKGSFASAAETDIEPGPEDHTYAKWFHRSFMKDKDNK